MNVDDPAAPYPNYTFLTRFVPRIVDVLHRDTEYWTDNDHTIDRPRTQLHVLAFVHTGTGTLRIDSTTYPLRAGTVFHVAPGRSMTIEVPRVDPACFYSIHFTYAVARWNGPRGTLDQAGTTPLPFPQALPVDGDPELENLFIRTLEGWTAVAPGREWYAQADLIQILRQLCADTSEAPRETSAQYSVDRAVAYIAHNSGRPLDRDSVARRVGLSPGYFSTVFKRRTGLTFTAYLQTVRVDLAKWHLRMTDRPVHDIATQVGFDDPFYFSRVFRQVTGVTPRAYRTM